MCLYSDTYTIVQHRFAGVPGDSCRYERRASRLPLTELYIPQTRTSQPVSTWRPRSYASPLPPAIKLVLIYRPWRDARLSCMGGAGRVGGGQLSPCPMLCPQLPSSRLSFFVVSFSALVSMYVDFKNTENVIIFQ